MRQKDANKPKDKEKTNTSYHVTDGITFTVQENDNTNYNHTSKTQEQVSTKNILAAEIDPNRNYSPYYTPKPKLGSKGGVLGRGAVDKSKRKVQFSLTCTPDQKKRFSEAAKKEKRKLPDFICLAVEEYMENHDL